MWDIDYFCDVSMWFCICRVPIHWLMWERNRWMDKARTAADGGRGVAQLQARSGVCLSALLRTRARVGSKWAGRLASTRTQRHASQRMYTHTLAVVFINRITSCMGGFSRRRCARERQGIRYRRAFFPDGSQGVGSRWMSWQSF